MKKYTTEEIQALLDEQARLTADFRKKGDHGVNTTIANRIKSDSVEWQQAQKKGMQEYVNSPDYVHPRGMLGKKGSQLQKESVLKALAGKGFTEAHKKKLSESAKGKHLSDETKQKLSDINTGKTHNRSKRVWTKEKGEFAKITLAAKAFGVSDGAIKLWCKTKPNEFKILDQDHLKTKKVKTPEGIFDSAKACAEHYKIGPGTVRNRLKNKNWPEWYYLD